MVDLTGDGINDVDITGAGSSTNIGGVIFTDAVNVGSGTGGYNTFLAISDNDGIEEGFNSDDTPPIDATNKDIDQAKTHTVKLSDLVIVTIGGVQYYQVRVDLNEANNDPNAQISLDEFQVYTSTSGTIQSTTTLFNPANATLKYDMDAGGDVSVLLSDAESSGSGTDDYSVLIPVSTFAGQDPATTYVYFYIKMGAAGTDWTATSTFEEWNLENGVTLTGTKFSDVDGDGIKDAGEGPVAGVTIFIDANKNGVFDAGERSTVTDANGNYTFFGVSLNQTVWIDEVIPAGATQTTGAHEEVVISANAAPGSTIVVDPIGNHIPVPDVHLEKDASVPGGTADAAGEVISYTLAVTNPGEVPLTGVVITDPYADPGSIQAVLQGDGIHNIGDIDDDNQLDLTETWSFTATHTVTQGEIDSNGGGDGELENTATVNTDQGVSDDDDAEVPIDQNPSLAIDKVVQDVDGDGADGIIDEAGDIITYDITVTNTGNVTLHNVTITDPLTGGLLHTVASLAPGASYTQQDVTYAVTQADLDSNGTLEPDNVAAGLLDNTAVADSDETGPVDDSEDVPIDQNPSLAIDKVVQDVDGDGADGIIDEAGDIITYDITVTNTGNITLHNVTITDPLTGGLLDTVASLAPGASYTVEDVTYTVTQDDLDSNGTLEPDNVAPGLLDNTAVADSDETGPVDDSEDVPIDQNPSILIEKDAVLRDEGDCVDSADDVIDYTVRVTNTGNVTIENVVVTDSFEGGAGVIISGPDSGDTDGDGNLDVGETWVYTYSHDVTQEELDSDGGNDALENTASVVGDVIGASTEEVTDEDDAEVDVCQNPAILIEKDAVLRDEGDCVDDADDVIDYTVRVTNTGNVTLENVVVTDSFEGGAGVIISGPDSGDTDGDGNLDVGETWTYTYSHDVTQEELDSDGGGNDALENTASVVGDVIGASTEEVTDEDDAEVDVCQNPAIEIEKDAVLRDEGDCVDDADDVIDYTVRVTNTGNVTLENVVVTDSFEGGAGVIISGPDSGDTDGDGNLDVGETWIYTYSRDATQEDIDTNGYGNGTLDNTASVVGDVIGASTEEVTDDDDALVDVCPDPSIDLEKYVAVDSTDGTDGTFVDADSSLGPQNVNLGADVWFKVTVENTGNVTLTGVDIVDDNQTGGGSINFDLMQDGALTADAINNHSATLDGDTDGDGDLDVGETWTIVYRQAFDPGEHLNVATVTTEEGPTDEDAAYYFSLVDEGLCPRTPGFWQNPNNGGQFWDGIQGNEKHAGEDGFPEGELLYNVDSNNDGVINGSDAKGLLIGDYDKDGFTDLDEDTLFVSYADAQTLINASNKQLNGGSGDGRYILGRDMVASWLNYLQGSGFGEADDTQSPHHYLDDAIDWMQIFSGKTAGGNSETFDALKLTGGAIKTNSATWNTPQSGIDHSAGQMHGALDYYNNTGQTQPGGTHYANCESEHLFEALSIYQQSHSIV